MSSVNLPEDAISGLLHANDSRDSGISSYSGKRLLRAKVNLGKTKVMVSSGITQDGFSRSEVGPCGVCSLRMKANSVLCAQCGRWTNGRCA